MNNKIKNILLMKDMSPSRFADEIGVQRSSISHILSGRNKPSLEIIQKIVRRFPELGSEWIFEEDEEIEDETDTQPEATVIKSVASKDNIIASSNGTAKEKTAIHIPLAEESEGNAKRKVERILIFYSDKTFTEYKPE
jgi:transcriptional regulator with XRE-family HTH domain